MRASRTYRLVQEPYWVGVIAAALRSTGSIRDVDDKIDGVLRVAANQGHRQLVLGAWGCGAFGNDAAQIAAAMVSAVKRCGRWFDHVRIAKSCAAHDLQRRL